MADAELRINTKVQIVKIEAIGIEQGDTLLVRIDARTSALEYSQLRAHLSQQLPGVNVVLVPTDQLIVQRGPQLDNPARPLVEVELPPELQPDHLAAVADDDSFTDRQMLAGRFDYEQQAATYDPARPGFEQGRPVF